MLRIQAMPPRRRPTARLLTPSGWVGAIGLLALAGALVAIAIAARG
jgi:hypothetical protein